MPGRKKDDKRLTLLVCSNETGTGKFPLLSIEDIQKPRCFKEKTGVELGFDYAYNNNPCMTKEIFSQ